MPQNAGTISRDDIRVALLRSGYLLEARVASTLAERGYYAEPNAAYFDPETQKSRELDVYALAGRKAGPGKHDYVFGALLAECVNNPQPLLLLTKDSPIAFLHHEEVRAAGLPVKILAGPRNGRWQRLSEFLGMKDYHHYCVERVATQYCSFVRKGGSPQREWMATHEGSHFDAFRKLADAVDFFQDRHFKSWRFGPHESINIEFYYPVLIVQGELLEARQARRSVKLRRSNHLQFRRSAITRGAETTYQIDVIRESFFRGYLALLEGELEKTARLLRRRHVRVRASLEEIAAQAKVLKSPERVRDAMDFGSPTT